MTRESVSDLEVRLRNMLVEQALEGTREEMRWLCERLAIYLDRWLGFAKREDVPVRATLNNKVFLVVDATMKVMSGFVEFAKEEEWCPSKQWMEFKNSIEWVRQEADRDALELIEKTFQALAKELDVGPME